MQKQCFSRYGTKNTAFRGWGSRKPQPRCSDKCSSLYELAHVQFPAPEEASPDEDVAALLEKRCLIGGSVPCIFWISEMAYETRNFIMYALNDEDAIRFLGVIDTCKNRTALLSSEPLLPSCERSFVM
jgi:hypothetical protein